MKDTVQENVNTNVFEVIKVQCENNVIHCQYEITGNWKKYFAKTRMFFVEYSTVIEGAPESVAVIPLLCNILPVAWIMDAVIKVQSVDEDFLEHLGGVKLGYQNMYPMIPFGGRIEATPQKNERVDGKGSASSIGAFFSGGVDAYATMMRHLDKISCLMTLWGADIPLNDTSGWELVWEHTKKAALEYGLQAVSIKTNFREILNERELDKAVQISKDGWWHGFQHGIGIIGHAAPVVYSKNLKGEDRLGSICIASSYPFSMRGRYTCASDSTIDEQVHFCGCNVIHDGSDMNRQGKVRYIVSKTRELKKKADLRVCWESSGGKNCCHCEKCYRTILELVSEGADPNEYGFEWDEPHIRRCRRDMRYKIIIQPFMVEQYYPIIQKRFMENQAQIANYNMYQWLMKMDWDKFNDLLIKKIYNKLKKSMLVIRLYKILHHI